MTKFRLPSKNSISNIKNAKVLVLGAGFMGREYCKALRALGVHHVTVICNRSCSAAKIRKEFRFTAFQGGYKSHLPRLQDPYDLVIISLPIPILLECLQVVMSMGQRNILVEKPVTLSSADLGDFLKRNKRIKGIVVKAAFNRMAYPAYIELKTRVAQEGGITSCNYTFTEWIHTIDFEKNSNEVYSRWGISNSLHVISMAHSLIGLPKKWSCYRSQSLNWHPTGAIFTGSGVTKKNIPFSYHADWLSAGRWSLNIMTKKNTYQLMPLEKLYYCPLKTRKWECVKNKNNKLFVKEGLIGEIISMLQPKTASQIDLPDLKKTLNYIKVAEKIFGYKKT